MKRFIIMALCICTCMAPVKILATPELSLNAKSYLLMEASSGKVLLEHNADEKLPPASVTKIMTMLLVMEAIEQGKLTFDEIVTASEQAKRMGGSTIFLDTGEKMSVHDLMKGIAVASGNDACVAIAEHLAGSEREFVRLMNKRAAELGMKNTNFENCNGLDSDGHLTTARDVAIMSRELLKHEKILDYTTIWMDNLRGGAFELANTNKLIRFYDGANGLKTGSTSKAMFCVSATAKRDNMQLIAVVMASPTSKERFGAARAMLDYGFANYAVVKTDMSEPVGEVPVEKGGASAVPVRFGEGFTALVTKGRQRDIESRAELMEKVTAPVAEGDVLGKVGFYLDGELLGEASLVAAESVSKKGIYNTFMELMNHWLK